MCSDVFVRHMRGCQKGLSDNSWSPANRSKSRTKTKRACDECAKAKAKCDQPNPCDRCRRKSLNCEKTRNGYEDPYSTYSIQNLASTDIELENSASTENADNIITDYGHVASYLDIPSIDTTVHVSAAIPHGQDQAYLRQQQIEKPNNPTFTCLPSPPSEENSETCFNMPDLFAPYGLARDALDIPFEPDPASIYFTSVGNLEYLFNSQSQSKLI